MADEEDPYDDGEKTRGTVASPSSSSTDQSPAGCCGSCVTRFRDEFHVRNFGFSFPKQEAFKTSQWRWPSCIFISYRLTVAIYSVSIVIWTASRPWKYEYPWPTWVTNWSYSFLTLHLVYSAIVAFIHSCRRSKTKGSISSGAHPYGAVPAGDSLDKTVPQPDIQLHLKVGWFIFVVASGSAPIVSTVYWVFLAPDTGVPFWQNDSINQHLMNTVIVVLELVISAIPVRIFHFVYITAFGFAYAVFTAIYWAVDHNNILYKSFTNWNKPTNSIIRLSITMFVVAPIIQLVMFGVYQVRLGIYRCLYHESYTRPAPEE